ncbi:MAG TPA: malto-oligosyltrehalose synthase, partial [Streptosporangiaceae bacterium]|nr:malto-oligosyltrehalose synthase [Streptosporangiaceae bacterium]
MPDGHEFRSRSPAGVSRGVPASTYRLQLNPEFGFAAAGAQAGYLASLGVTHAYLSPILQAAPGSTHGYDVTDHSQISAELGGEQEFRSMAAEFAGHGVGILADIVPNHMAMPAHAYLNRQLWSVLRDGQDSLYAHWFDIDWAMHGGRMLLPVLPGPLDSCLSEFTVCPLSVLPDAPAAGGQPDPAEPVLRYRDHVLPLRPGTADLPMRDLLDGQHYRLSWWKIAAAQLNWRRFFDISSLIAVRVEEPDVFAATHGLMLGLVAEGLVDGLRVDHPDGLADPRSYLEQLATATDGAYVVAEKILSRGERLPADWDCAGTTGYDALAAVAGLFTDPDGVAPLSRTYANLTDGPAEFAPVAWAGRREAAGEQLTAEVALLARLAAGTGEPTLRQLSQEDLRLVLAELLAAFGVYRAYVVPGSAPPQESVRQVDAAAVAARRRLPAHLRGTVDTISALLLGRGVPADGRPSRDQLITAFQQTCAAIQAKGVEDTALYRWSRLACANEVGGDPDQPGLLPADFHAFAARQCADWPGTLTALSTHDTKRQEDVRARLAVLADEPQAWTRAVTGWHRQVPRLAAGQLPDPDTEYLLWQTLVGAWPISADRLTCYLRKAMREAKLSTSWTSPDAHYEAAVLDLATAIVTDTELAGQISSFVAAISPDAAVNSLGAKLVQLTMPGVPDVYQGCELAAFSLVDPDNRRPVDYARRRVLLAALDEAGPGSTAGPGNLDAAKLHVTSRALRLRRDHPEWFAADYRPLAGGGA